MLKYFLITIFALSFLTSVSVEAAQNKKQLKKQSVQKVAVIKKKATSSKIVKNKKTVAKVKKSLSKKQTTTAKLMKNKKPIAKSVKTKKAQQRSVVRVDFSKPQKALKPRQELKKVAKLKAQKKNYRSLPCRDGYIVGHQAFCADEVKPVALGKKAKGQRNLASSKDLSAKKRK